MAFTVTVHGSYIRDEVPPRCRKPRPVRHETTASATIAEVNTDDAPVALRVHRTNNASEIRTHHGRLYAPYLPIRRQQDPTIPGDAQFPAELTEEHSLIRGPACTADSAEGFADAVNDCFARFLIIDGTVWVETPEPGYLVDTFGLGGNHGGTGLMPSTRRDHGTLFRADEFDAALAHAVDVAAERGDTQYVARFTENPEDHRTIEVLIPEAIKLVTIPATPKPVRDLRFDYDSARRRLDDAKTPQEEAEAFAKVCDLRASIIEHGHAPIKPDVTPYEDREITQD